MTKGHIKKGKAGGNAFDLLRAVLADKEDKQAAALFAEFAKAFKGKRQLSWSNGLKAKFNLAEKNDEELASELEDNAELLGLLTPTSGVMFSRSGRGLLCLSWRLLLAGLRSKNFWHLSTGAGMVSTSTTSQ